MKKIMYCDASSGVSGDMFVGALIDLGADFEKIRQDILSLNIGVEIHAKKILTHGITAVKFSVTDIKSGLPADDPENRLQHTHRHLQDIKEIIEMSKADKEVKKSAIAVFESIAKAEGEVHGIAMEKVHFHEVGAADSITDIVAAASAFHSLDIDFACRSPINTGCGTVECAHGILPVPAPAVLKILTGMKAYSDGTPGELATPTGTALLKYFSQACHAMPEMTVTGCGYGAGYRDIGRPNVFRVILGETD